MNKYLIVRFSSFGDIAQALPCVLAIRNSDPSAEIHWLTRSDFHDFVKSCSSIDQVWSLDRKEGFKGLIALIRKLRREHYTHIYDAHANLRSFLVSVFLRLSDFNIKFIRRSKERLKRILLFRLHINIFPKPFRGIESFLKPLNKWFCKMNVPDPFDLVTEGVPLALPQGYPLSNAVVLAPGATWELKRWPTEYWVELVQACPQYDFILLGGENDEFCKTIADAGRNVLNLQGRLSWLQSTKLLSLARVVVSADTGVLHVADVIGKEAIALIGPTAFGYPTRASTHIAEVQLSCRPCTKDGRGRCRNVEYKKCLRDIKPELVARLLRELDT